MLIGKDGGVKEKSARPMEPAACSNGGQNAHAARGNAAAAVGASQPRRQAEVMLAQRLRESHLNLQLKVGNDLENFL